MLTSFRHPLIKQIKRLQQKKYRQREELFFVEGLRVVLTALEYDAPLEALVYAPDLLTSPMAHEALERQRGRGVRCEAITADLFRHISGRENPTGLGAIIRRTTRTLGNLIPTPQARWVALIDVADPGNVGAILRTLDAVGADGLILVGQTTDAEHPAAVKASMGASFAVPVATADSADLWAWAYQHHLHIVATTAKSDHSYWQAHYPTPTLLLMGSEQHGLSAEQRSRAHQIITIPMMGQTASSLNLGIATALILYEMKRQQSVS